MKALLKKDFYVLWNSMKALLLLIVIFSLIPSGFQNVFAVLYAAMLPYSALAYDERSHWDQMAAAMPYSTRDIVRSKYVLGWITSAGAFLFSTMIQLVVRSYLKMPTPVSLLFVSMCISWAIIAITLPFMFRWGVEKARLTMVLIIALVCGAAGALTSIATMSVAIGGDKIPFPLIVSAPVAAIVINLISMPLSEKWYERRK